MKSKYLTGFVLGLLILGTDGVANADSITFLEDFRDTNDTSDVVHLGDQYYPEFFVPAAQGHTITYDFGIPEELLNANVFLTITHYAANPDMGYYDHIFVNSVDLGSLSYSPDHWLSEQFQFSGSILNLTGNNLTINSYILDANYDDFEFTNLHLAPVPIPGTAWLLGAGIVGLARIRTRKRNK